MLLKTLVFLFRNLDIRNSQKPQSSSTGKKIWNGTSGRSLTRSTSGERSAVGTKKPRRKSAGIFRLTSAFLKTSGPESHRGTFLLLKNEVTSRVRSIERLSLNDYRVLIEQDPFNYLHYLPKTCLLGWSCLCRFKKLLISSILQVLAILMSNKSSCNYTISLPKCISRVIFNQS